MSATLTGTRTDGRGPAAVRAAFEAAKRENRAAFIGYLPAGFPTRGGFLEGAAALLKHADMMEVGLPYSDPLGDGPVIQRAAEVALAGGMTVRGTFEAVAAIRERSPKPLFVMTYFNPILATGPERFLDLCVQSGLDGLILPDLPPDEDDAFRAQAAERGVALTFLVAPTSTEARIRIVSAASTGFVYAVSVTGVTGARDLVNDEVPGLVAGVRRASDTPVAVGFGVSSRETAARVASSADGVVVGSALVTALEQGPERLSGLAAEIAAGCRAR
ncbi:MAG TPA: tryptophan synthase subunit alpha [Deinococcales bacterium]|nr:tryptophan synthase subunit alpha [Deinococcales bacterium]